jgi:hypothetical protein
VHAPVGCKIAGFTARRQHAGVIPRISDRLDQASLGNPIQEVVHHRFVLRENNIDMHNPRQPV